MHARSPSALTGASRQSLYTPSAPVTPSATPRPPTPPHSPTTPCTLPQWTQALAMRPTKRGRDTKGEDRGSDGTSSSFAAASRSGPLALRAQSLAQRLTEAPPPTATPASGPGRPPLLAIPPAHRTDDDFRAYFQAGGKLERIREDQRSLRCCRIAIEHQPRALKAVPFKLRLHHPWLCQEAVSRDGYALESVPKKLLAARSPVRERLCQMAYDSPRPPRIRDVPPDLLTEARAIRSLRWAPLDLQDIPEPQITTAMCLAFLEHIPQVCLRDAPDTIPRRLRDGRIAEALLGHRSLIGQGTPPSEAWYLPGAITPRIVSETLRIGCHQVLQGEHFSTPVPFAHLAGHLAEDREEFYKITADQLARVLIASARAEGIAPGAALPRGPWPAGTLPPRLTDVEVYRWATARTTNNRFGLIPEHLRQDREIGRNIIRGTPVGLRADDPDILLAHAEVLLESLTDLWWLSDDLPDAVLRGLDPEALNRFCQSSLRRDSWNVLATKLQHRVPDLLNEETRALMRPEPAPPSAFSELPREERTQESYEAAVARHGWKYRQVPEAHRNWPLLLKALESDNSLLDGTESLKKLVPGGVTEAMCLEAMETLGLSPADIAPEIRVRPSFRDALRTLRVRHFSEEALARAIDDDVDAPPPDDLTVAWVDQRLQEDPGRVLALSVYPQLEWALSAYHQGKELDLMFDGLPSSGRLRAEFLAEIGPFTSTMDGPARAASGAFKPAASSGSSLASPPRQARAPG